MNAPRIDFLIPKRLLIFVELNQMDFIWISVGDVVTTLNALQDVLLTLMSVLMGTSSTVNYAAVSRKINSNARTQFLHVIVNFPLDLFR